MHVEAGLAIIMVVKIVDTNMQGIVLILVGALLLTVMDGVIKQLLESDLSVLQILAVRSWLVIPFMVLWSWRALPTGALRTNRPALHFVRVVLAFFAPFAFFSALETLPLADATVIFFGATFIMTALSVPFLKEYVGPHRWAAVVVGLVGVVIASDPSGDFWQGGAVLALAASVAYSLSMLITRWMGPGEGAFKQVLYFHAWIGTVSSVYVLANFQPMTLTEVLLIGVVTGLAVAGQLCLTRAFSIAPVGLVAPFEYSAMVWATLIGFFVWGDVPGSLTIIGAGIIVTSGLYLLHREHLQKRREKLVAVEAMEAVPSPIAVPVTLGYGAQKKVD